MKTNSADDNSSFIKMEGFPTREEEKEHTSTHKFTPSSNNNNNNNKFKRKINGPGKLANIIKFIVSLIGCE